MSRDLIFVALSLFVWGMGESGFIYFQPLYLQKLGANPVSIGAILGAAGIAMTIAHIPAGLLADRVGRRPLMWVSWMTGIIATWIMALAHNLPVFVVGLLLYGLTMFVIAPMNSYITSASGKWSVARTLTLVSASYNTGAILGPLLGGFIGDRLGLRYIFFASGTLFIVSTILIFFIRAQPIEKHPDEDHPQRLSLTRPYLIYLGVIFLAQFATYLPQPLSSNYLQNQHTLGLAQIGQLGSIASMGIVFFNLVLGQLDARTGFLLSQLSVGIFSFILFHATGMPLFALAYFMLGGFRVLRSLATAQTRALVHVVHMGLAYGITETIGGIVIILSPPVAGFLYERNPLWVYGLSVILVLVSLLVSLKFFPRSSISQSENSPANLSM